MTTPIMEPKLIDLYEFFVESELQHYYNSIRTDLKINNVSQLKYATDEDLRQVGLTRPEIRRLRKYYEKYYPHGYFNKIKRLLQNPKKDDPNLLNQGVTQQVLKEESSPSKIPSNKHIIPADTICVNKQLGTGEFGIVQQGVWTNGSERIQVAIKCLCRERMQSNPMDFLKEAAIMHSIEHENIVRLYGVVLDTDALMLVTELAHLRSLLECLKDSSLRVSFLTVPTLCEFAMQICNGMMYLENKRLIHRDLAARNILVFSKNKVKISDFGLSRALGVGKDYYQTNFNVNLKLPIAWCAPECINFLRFTNASDVWAYGVCLWEMFSYGFQPWAALTGHQILEAIDEPNYQRLEQPECCPKEYYMLMLNCWRHDPNKRQKFNEIYSLLPDIKPEQLKTVVAFSESKKEYLMYRQNEIITVLDRTTNTPYWKGVLNSGKTGLFNPANTVAFIGNLPSSNNRDSFNRTMDRSSKRKLKTEMISRPQNDLKHTGHVGLDGAYFGDVSFLPSTQHYNHLPRQIVTPYKPSEDLEQTPLLLPPTPTSPDSIQTASGYFPENGSSSTNHSFNAIENSSNLTQRSDSFITAFDFPNSTVVDSSSTSMFSGSNPFVTSDIHSLQRNINPLVTTKTDEFGEEFCFQTDIKKSMQWDEQPHEYHEISDDEIPANIDLGPSLLDEMNLMFKSMSANTQSQQPPPLSPDIDHTNKKNEITELTSKLHRKNSSGAGSSSGNSVLSTGPNKTKKKGGTVKPISVKDEKMLNQAIEMANEISARSMTDLVSDQTTTQSPKRKFSFRFPNLTSHGGNGATNFNTNNNNNNCSNVVDKDATIGAHHNSHGNVNVSGNTNTLTQTKERKPFTDDLKNVTDLQNTITEEYRQAYNSLVEKPTATLSKLDIMRTAYDMGEINLMDMKPSASTLPRKIGTTSSNNYHTNIKSVDLEFNLQKLCTSPKSKRLCITADQDTTDSNPLRILRDKNFPMVRSRTNKQCTTGMANDENGNQSILNDINSYDNDAVAESPSYLKNPEYSFSERDVNIHNNSTKKEIATKDIDSLNPLPLPPRDRNKVMQLNVKRHVRKHPLIIPASGVQRTLNRISQNTPVEEKSFAMPSIQLSSKNEVTDTKPLNQFYKLNSNNNNNNNNNSRNDQNLELSLDKIKELDHCYVNQNDSNISTFFTKDNKKYDKNMFMKSVPMYDDRTYENLEMFNKQLIMREKPTSYSNGDEDDDDDDNIDSASLHFESILENDINKIGGDNSSPDVVDFCCFDPRNNYGSTSTSNNNNNNNQSKEENKEIDNEKLMEIEKKKLEFSEKYPKYAQPKNELANNVLFNKIKETVDSAKINDSTSASVENDNSIRDERTDAMHLQNNFSHSVSCEDLLEFADKKPKGRERGIESDEVRIMSKVLGKEVQPEQCLYALNFIEWNVHKAIKLCKLQKILHTNNLSLSECFDALQNYEWDLQKAALQINIQN